MAMLPTTVGELRKYLETFDDDTKLSLYEENDMYEDYYPVLVTIEQINGNRDKAVIIQAAKQEWHP